MEGKITITHSANITVHTYTSPDNGWSVNTHIIELANQLLLVDAQLLMPYAKEAATYAHSLGKPITTLYVSHHHPDHFFGAYAFNTATSALAETAKMIAATGDVYATAMHARLGNLVPETAPRVDVIINPGTETIDGVELELIHLKNAESVDSLVIGLPNHGIIVTQDMVYNHIHPYLGDRAFDEWAEDLRQYRSLHQYTIILPGHGDPAGPELYDNMLDYLAVAKEAYRANETFTDFSAALKEATPGYHNDALLKLSERYMFPKQ